MKAESYRYHWLYEATKKKKRGGCSRAGLKLVTRSPGKTQSSQSSVSIPSIGSLAPNKIGVWYFVMPRRAQQYAPGSLSSYRDINVKCTSATHPTASFSSHHVISAFSLSLFLYMLRFSFMCRG